MLIQFVTALGTLLRSFPALVKKRPFAYLLAALVLVAALSLLFLQGCMLKAQELEIQIEPNPSSQPSSDTDQNNIPSDDISWANSVAMTNGRNLLRSVTLSFTRNISSLYVRREHMLRSLREKTPSFVFRWKRDLGFDPMEVLYEKA